ncbi:hypothetical protein HDU67_008960 [Dinochytrium kinnereticum]|nr:hypothetical protein HDU67_008960 [Dinochytrium kinnereticum]
MLANNKKRLSDVERLEMENRKMEDRLQSLRDYLAIQKEKRGESESVWKAGRLQRGSLGNYAGDVLAKRGVKKASFKGVAGEAQSIEDAMRSALPKDPSTITSVTTAKQPVPPPPKPPLHAPTAPPGPPPRKLWRVPTAISEPKVEELEVDKKAEEEENKGREDQSLLSGSFDEEESRRLFLQALAAWRQKPGDDGDACLEERGSSGGEKDAQASTSTHLSFTLRNSTPDSICSAAIDAMSFDPLSDGSGLSYFDRLLLKRYRDVKPVEEDLQPRIVEIARGGCAKEKEEEEEEEEEVDVRPLVMPLSFGTGGEVGVGSQGRRREVVEIFVEDFVEGEEADEECRAECRVEEP